MDDKNLKIDVDITNSDDKDGASSSHFESSHSSNHHHHHHHSSKHRHHHSSRRKRKNKDKKNETKLVLILCASLFVVFLVAFISIESTKLHFSNNNVNSNEPTVQLLTVKEVNAEGVLVKNAVNKYVLTDLLSSYNSAVLPSDFSNEEGRLDMQVPVSLKLAVKNGISAFYKIELSTNSNFENATVSYIEASDTVFDFKHLCTNTQYYYRVTAYTEKGVDVETGDFKTADTPRILSIDGLTNVRDIGNWRTDSGKRIKQGLLIRGTEMDAAVESGYHLTNKGLDDMINVFGIKTDMDLRSQTATCMDALGSRVEHRYYNMVMYDAVFTEAGKEKIRMVFSDLANPDNYPVYLHCTYGCDRTGTVCYLLEALLGVSMGDCLKDYGLSNLNIQNIKMVETGLNSFEGDTLKEKTEAYLLSCGVSEYQIESIRKIFLGD